MIELTKDDFYWYDKPAIDSPLYDYFLSGLKEIYWSENQLALSLRKLSDHAFGSDLKILLDQHVEHVRMQAARLERILENLKEAIEPRKCEAICGLIRESYEVVEYTEDGSPTRDTGIALVSERIARYEAIVYEGLIKVGKAIGRNDISTVLGHSLSEEQGWAESLSLFTKDALHRAHNAA